MFDAVRQASKALMNGTDIIVFDCIVLRERLNYTQINETF